MKSFIFKAQTELLKRWGALPAPDNQPLDGRVLIYQQFLMDRFNASLGVPPPSLCQLPFHTDRSVRTA